MAMVRAPRFFCLSQTGEGEGCRPARGDRYQHIARLDRAMPYQLHCLFALVLGAFDRLHQSLVAACDQ